VAISNFTKSSLAPVQTSLIIHNLPGTTNNLLVNAPILAILFELLIVYIVQILLGGLNGFAMGLRIYVATNNGFLLLVDFGLRLDLLLKSNILF
jgi:hypothetical protein